MGQKKDTTEAVTGEESQFDRGLSISDRVKLFFNKIKWVALVTLVNYVVCSMLFSVFENRSIGDGLWWSAVTGFTVGYGDIYPETATGRVVGVFLMVSMWVLFAVLLALIIDVVRVNRDNWSHEEQVETMSDVEESRAISRHLYDQFVANGTIEPMDDLPNRNLQ